MRVLQLTSHLNVGGVTRSVLTVSAGLRRRGHRVIVASGGGALRRRLDASGCEHWDVPLATSVEFGPSVWRARSLLADLLRKDPVDVIHAHTRVAQVVAAGLSAKAGVPYVTTWHGFFRPNWGRRLWPCAGARAIAVSDPVRDHLVRDLRIRREIVRVIPHGIDAAEYEPVEDAGALARIRRSFGLAEAGPVVGTITRLIRSRAVDQLIEAWSRTAEAHPSAQLLIIGDGEDRERLRRLTERLPQAGRVRFVPSVDVTREALSVTDVFVFLPAEKEGFGLVLLEAMAAFRPIVSINRGGGSAWLLEQSGVGRLVEPASADALAGAISALLKDPRAARTLGERAGAVVRERYGIEGMMDAYESVYTEVVQGR